MNKNIDFFSLDRQYRKIKTDLLKTVENVFDTQSFVGGNFVQNFENKMSEYTKAKHTIACNSGTDALWLALKALDLPKNGIVLTTPFSFIASSSEVSNHEGHPVFIDIEHDTYNINPVKLEQWLEDNTVIKNKILVEKQTGYPVCGIITVDIFGQCADYKKIKNIADKYNLWIIEDACQAIGSQDNTGLNAGNLGDIACFSFYPTKNLGAFGDAGCCTTNDPLLAEKLLQLRNHGRKSHYNYTMQGINSRLDGVQAAILLEKIKYLEEYNSRRIEIADIYNKELSNLKNIKLPVNNNNKHVYHQYCIQLDNTINRQEIIDKLKALGVGTNIYYPKALNEIEFLNKEPKLKTECPIAINLTQTVLALPIWPELENEEVKYICDCIKKVL